MTTGPIDRETVINGTGVSFIVYKDGSQTQPRYNHFERRVAALHRPASTSTVPSVSHWREPTNWYNRGVRKTNVPSGVVVIRELAPERPWLQSDHYLLDGGGISGYIDLPDPAFPTGLVDRAVTKALLKLKNQHVNLAVAFAERKETAEMFESAAGVVVSDVLGFKRRYSGQIQRYAGNWKGFLRRRIDPSHVLGNAWLQLVYGWMPFMQDLFGSCEGLAYREKDHDSNRVTVVASVREEQRLDSLWAFGKVSYTGVYVPLVTIVRHTAHVSLTYTLRNELLASLSQWGITNPLEVVWERVPYSFVVDWFLPVGQYLQTLDANYGWDFVGGSVGTMTRVNQRSTQVRWVEPQPGQYQVLEGYCEPIRNSRWTFNRHVYKSSPLPRAPRFKSPFSGIHVVNALALLRNLVR